MDANDRPRLILVLGDPNDLPILGVGDPNDVNELLAVEFLWVTKTAKSLQFGSEMECSWTIWL